MKKQAWLVIAFVALVATGCTTMESTAPYHAYRNDVDSMGTGGYVAMTFHDLLLDFTDIFSAGISFGPGLLVDVQYTKLGEVGLGYADVVTMGWYRRGAGFYREKRAEGGASMLYYRRMDMMPITGTVPLFTQRLRALRDFTIRHNSDRHWLDIGGNFQVVAFGADAYFSPYETADFLVDVVALPYNALFRPWGNAHGFRPPEIDLSDDDTTAIARHKEELTVVNPEPDFLPAEIIDEWFRPGY